MLFSTNAAVLSKYHCIIDDTQTISVAEGPPRPPTGYTQLILKTYRNGLHYWQLISHVTLIFCFPVLCSVSRSSVGYVFLQYPLSLWDNFIAATLQKRNDLLLVWPLSSKWKMELSASTGVDARHHSLSRSYIYMRMLYMVHIPYDIYVSHSPHPFLCVLPSPPTPSLVTKMLSLNHPSALLDRRRYYETYVRYVGSL